MGLAGDVWGKSKVPGNCQDSDSPASTPRQACGEKGCATVGAAALLMVKGREEEAGGGAWRRGQRPEMGRKRTPGRGGRRGVTVTKIRDPPSSTAAEDFKAFRTGQEGEGSEKFTSKIQKIHVKIQKIQVKNKENPRQKYRKFTSKTRPGPRSATA